MTKKLDRQGGRRSSKHVPERTCIGCRTKRPKRELVRVVRSAEGHIVIDETGKYPGRGAYLCRRRDCWALALKRASLNRALRTTLSSEDIATLYEFSASLPEA
jgi:hypothetical protein